MSVFPVRGVTYWYDDVDSSFKAPGRSALPLGRGAIPGTYFPDATNTGLLTTTGLTNVTTTTTYNSANDGQTVTDKHFSAYVNVSGVKNLTFKNCWFEPPASGRSGRGTVMGRNARNENVVFEDCLFTNSYKDPLVQNGYMGRGAVLRRCDISGAVDGIGAAPEGANDRTDLVLEACWIHDLLYITPFSGQSDNQTHTDGLQWHGGPGLTINGCRIEAFSNDISDWNVPPTPSATSREYGNSFYPRRNTTSIVMVNSSASFAPSGDLHITNNWLDGGAVGINMVGVPTLFLTDDGSEITGNHFGYDYGFANDIAIYCKSNHVFELSGNSRWVTGDPYDTSIPFNVRKHG